MISRIDVVSASSDFAAGSSSLNTGVDAERVIRRNTIGIFRAASAILPLAASSAGGANHHGDAMRHTGVDVGQGRFRAGKSISVARALTVRQRRDIGCVTSIVSIATKRPRRDAHRRAARRPARPP